MSDQVIAWMRDLDGTGSFHVCAKDDPGSFAVYGEPHETDLLEALKPFAHATLLSDGKVVGLMSEDFDAARSAVAKATTP